MKAEWEQLGKRRVYSAKIIPLCDEMAVKGVKDKALLCDMID